MFDFLDNSKVTDTLPAGHHALQFVRQWAITSINASKLEALADLPPVQFELSKQIVNEIENQEGIPIGDLPPLKVDEYIRILSNRLQEVAFQEFQVDKERGRSLLNELRAQQN